MSRRAFVGFAYAILVLLVLRSALQALNDAGPWDTSCMRSTFVSARPREAFVRVGASSCTSWRSRQTCLHALGDVSEELLAKAESGDVEAQYAVGLKLSRGISVEDRKWAAHWLQKSADRGDARAQHELGMLYADGIGVEENLEVAAAWISAAANQGLAVSQHQMGMMLYRGAGVAVNHEWARYWFEQAASQETLTAPSSVVSEAQYCLGLMHLTGEGGLEVNRARAAFWFERAAERGNMVASDMWQKIRREGQLEDAEASEFLQWKAQGLLAGPKG